MGAGLCERAAKEGGAACDGQGRPRAGASCEFANWRKFAFAQEPVRLYGDSKSSAVGREAFVNTLVPPEIMLELGIRTNNLIIMLAFESSPLYEFVVLEEVLSDRH
eukprot:5746676-Pleurochrysis_carterae.AAC.4